MTTIDSIQRDLAHFQASRAELSSKFRLKVLSEGSVSCRKGCDHCCHYPVMISLLEALSVYRGIVRARLWTTRLKAAFKKHSDQVRGLNIEVWILSQIPCPLLHNNQCSVYSSRPFICQTVYSRSDPYYCLPSHSQGLPSVVPRLEMLTEMSKLETTLLNKHRLGRVLLPLSMAVLLAERLDKGEIDFAESGVIIWKDYLQRW